MNTLPKKMVVLVLCIVVTGCSAMFVPATSDPAKKLGYAYQLVQYQGRPLPAEGLIRDAIEIYAKDQNDEGLMKAYWTYGVFFQSKAVKNLQKIYEQDGFMDKTATFKNRYEKSIEYFNKAEILATKLHNKNMIANMHYNKASAYLEIGDIQQACKSFASCLEFNRQFHHENPDAKFSLEDGSLGSFEEYAKSIESYRGVLKCE
jgi:tetratricopeptide (TPR) repeat protein